jgi:hypothetical protein
VLLAVLTAAAAPALASAALPQQSGFLDLRNAGEGALRVDGEGAGSEFGQAVSSAGDFDGDGVRDVAMGGWRASPFGRTQAGQVTVVFGPSPGTGAAGGPDRIRIFGADPGDSLGLALTTPGDVNGDGLSDLLIGAQYADNAPKENIGVAYVVFGSRTRRDVDVRTLGGAGYRILGAAAGDSAGASVAAAGDVDGDRLADMLVGAIGADFNNRTSSGSTYLVRGARSAADVDLAQGGPRLQRFDGPGVGDATGFRVANAGDVNGDGRTDILIGAPRIGGQPPRPGLAWVVFGSASSAPVDLASLGTRGFRLELGVPGDQLGVSLGAVGDTDGDGRGEILVGASGAAKAPGYPGTGAVFLVRGSGDPATVNLNDLGARAVRVDGAAPGDGLGTSLAVVGDVNGDGRGDIMLGAPGMSRPDGPQVGGGHLVLALPSAGRLDLGFAAGAAIEVRGASAVERAGSSVAGVGDVTGDGRPDVAVGLRLADSGPVQDTGGLAVVLGYGPARVAYPVTEAAGRTGTALAPLGPSQVLRTGPAVFSVSPALPAGLTLDPLTGVLAGTPQAASARRRYEVTMTDLSGSASAPLDLSVAGTAAAVDRVRQLGVRRLRVSCVTQRSRKRLPCRIRVQFTAARPGAVGVEVRTRRGRLVGTVRMRVRTGVNRLTLPARINRRAVPAGRYQVRLRGLTVRTTVVARGQVRVVLRRGLPAR